MRRSGLAGSPHSLSLISGWVTLSLRWYPSAGCHSSSTLSQRRDSLPTPARGSALACCDHSVLSVAVVVRVAIGCASAFILIEHTAGLHRWQGHFDRVQRRTRQRVAGSGRQF